MLKKLLKFFFYTFLIAVLVTGSIATLVYVYRDKVILLFVKEADKYLNSKVLVDKIEFEFWETFPYFSLDFKNIKIMEPGSETDQYLAQAENLYISLSFKDLLLRRYKIRKLYVKNGRVSFKILADGSDNFSIIKKGEGTSNQLIIFKLSDVRLDNIKVTMEDRMSANSYEMLFKKTDAKFLFVGDDWDIGLRGNLFIYKILLDKWEFLKEKNVTIDSKVIYSQKENTYKIRASTLSILNALFKLEGEVSFRPDAYADIRFSEQNSDFQTILSLLPGKLAESLYQYRSKGDIYFKGLLKGDISRGKKPLVKIDFGCRKAYFYHPEVKEGIADASFTGEFNNGAGKDNAQSFFKLQHINATIQGRKISGNFLLTNFNDPLIAFDAKTSLDASYLLKIFPNETIDKASGQIDLDINFEGKSKDIKQKKYGALTSGGNIKLSDLNLAFKKYPRQISNLQADFTFDKTNIKIQSLKMLIGKSDIKLDGEFKNVLPYLLFQNENLGIVANFSSEFLHLNELLAASKNDTIAEKLIFPSYFTLDISGKVSKIIYKKYNGTNMSFNAKLKDKQLNIENLKMNIGKGAVEINSTIHAQKDSIFLVDLRMKTDKMAIDSIFYITSDFGQSFLTYKNIQGQLSADIKAGFKMNNKMEPDSKTLLADINMRVVNGRLVGFKPMQNLSKFVNEEALSDIKFSELKNNFLISNRTVYIPEMIIKSNITTMNIMGTHTFDNYFEYRLKVPLRNYKKKGNLEEEQALETNGSNGFFLYLTIKGTPDNYKIAYDKSAVKQKIKERWQEEKKEFKELFNKDYIRNKQEKEKIQELDESEYLDL